MNRHVPIIHLDTYFMLHGDKKMRDLGQKPAPDRWPYGWKVTLCWLLVIAGSWLLVYTLYSALVSL